MFKQDNPLGFYPGEEMPKLSKAEVLFFGLLQSGAVKLEQIPMPKEGDEISYVDGEDPKVAGPLNQNLALLASLYEQCRRFAARHEESAS